MSKTDLRAGYDDYEEYPLRERDRINYLISHANLKKYKSHILEEASRIKQIHWESVSYTIYVLPKATPRPRLGLHGTFYVKGAYENKKFFKQYFEETKDIPLIRTPCKFKCKTFAPTPKSMHPIEKILAEMRLVRPISKPDWDNLAKTYTDMIQGTLLYDDALIIEGSLKKYYSVKPRIEVEISWMTEYDSNFNKKKMMKGMR